MTDQTTPLPTPAQDALAAALENFTGARAAFFAETVESLNGEMTAKEAIAEARRLTPWAQKQQGTKAAAIRVIANDRWGKTDAVKAHNALKRAADREQQIIDAIAKAPETTAAAQKAVLDRASHKHAAFNTEYLLDEVLGMQAAGIVESLWKDVDFDIRENGKSPIDALVSVRQHHLRSLLTQVRNLNRSSSSTRNLTVNTDSATTADWIEKTERLIP